VEAAGDTAKAAEIIQKKGLAKAVKAAGRIAADGAIVAEVSASGDKGVLVEVNCQTDFVARGDEFKKFATTVGQQALSSGAKDVDSLQDAKVDGKTLREHAEALTAKSGEKHAIRRMERFDAQGPGVITTYIHHGARLGVLVEIGSEKGASPEVTEFANEVALQIASMSPRWVRKDEVPADATSKQRDIFAGQMQNEVTDAVNEFEDFKRRMAEEGGDHSDKVKEHLAGLEKKMNGLKARPQAANDKILEGKVAKWLTEVVLLDQISVKDSKKKISDLVAEMSKGAKVEIRRFARFELGEGIEKGVAKDFATEVAEMAAKAQS